jgi:hypothetical protein
MPVSSYVSAKLFTETEILTTVRLELNMRTATNPSVRGWYFETRVLRSVDSGHELLLTEGMNASLVSIPAHSFFAPFWL